MVLTVLAADGHRLVREGVCALLRTQADFRLVGEADAHDEVLRLTERLRPDVLVLDQRIPGPEGLETVRRTACLSPRTRTVFLSTDSDEDHLADALRAGAAAYVLKESGADELFLAIREAAAGRRFISPSMSQTALQPHQRKARGRSGDPFDALTPREREVFRLTAEGYSGSAAAERLFISPRTVESHRANLMRKLGLRNHKELIRYAAQRGMLPDTGDPPPARKRHGDP